MNNDWLAIVLLTYNRRSYAEITLRNVLEHISYTGPVHVLIADDGSPEGYREYLKDVAGGYPNVKSTAISNAERGGYGKSVNLASQVTHSFAKYVLMVEDDWCLERTLNVDHFLAALNSGEIGCVRLGYLGFTDVLRGHVAYHGSEHYLVLDPSSPEKHVAAGHPRLETVAWQKVVGPWPEGLSPGATELAWCSIPNARQGVAWPMDYVKPYGNLFSHIGTERAY